MKNFNFQVESHPTQYELIPNNINELKKDFYQIGDIGFGGIIIKDTFSSTICYPTPNECESFENALFGQDAHNMVVGDFNGDGYEDFAVAWALFPHTIEPSQKVNAPINIFINNGEGRFEEDLNIYSDGSPPKHPFAYRLAVADFNNDGKDDIVSAFSDGFGINGGLSWHTILPGETNYTDYIIDTEIYAFELSLFDIDSDDIPDPSDSDADMPKTLQQAIHHFIVSCAIAESINLDKPLKPPFTMLCHPHWGKDCLLYTSDAADE